MEPHDCLENFENLSDINTEDEETKSIVYMNSDLDKLD